MTDAYEYFTAPANSFGIKEAKFIKWPYFWNLLHNNAVWQMEGWNPVTEEWQDNYEGTNLNNWLDIDLAPNEDGSQEKITLSFTSPYTTKYRFGFAFNLRVKQYIDNSGNHQYTLTIPTSDEEEDEEYEIIFDWSDVVPLIQAGTITVTHGIKEVGGKNYFWVRLTGNSNLPEGNTFVIDPWFGNQDTPTFHAPIDQQIYGSPFTATYTGTITDMVVNMFSWQAGKTIRLALYFDSDNSFIAETQSRTNNATGWQTFSFSTPINIVKDTIYILCALCTNSTDNSDINYSQPTGGKLYKDQSRTSYPATLVRDTTYTNYEACIYCTYETFEEGQSIKINKVPNKYITFNKVKGKNIKIG